MLRNYFKIAIRNLRHNKVYTFINIAGLALGIFGSIIIFQLVKYHLLTDTHHQKAARIYRVVMNLHLDDGSIEHEKGSPYILHETLKNDFATVENTVYVGQQELTVKVSNKNGAAAKFLEKEAAAFIGSAYFKVFDYQWLAGQAGALDAPNTAVLTERYAKKYFGSSNVINKVLIINNEKPVKIVGLLEDIPENTDLKTEVFISCRRSKPLSPTKATRNGLGLSNQEKRT